MIAPLRITAHPVANVILLQYAQRAQYAGTRFERHETLPRSLSISDSGFPAFLTNLLSIALEAAQGEKC